VNDCNEPVLLKFRLLSIDPKIQQKTLSFHEGFLRSLLLDSLSTGITLLGDRELDSSSLGKRDRGFRSVSDDEDVGKTSSELSVEDVTDVNDIVTSEVTFLVDDGSDATLVTTTGEHDELTLLEGDNLDDLVLGEVELDRVSNLDDRVGVTDGSSIVGNDERNTLGSELDLLDLEKLVGSLLLRDSVDGEATLDVVKETEVLSRLLDRDDILETGGVGLVGSDLVVDLDEALLDDEGDLTSGKSVLQTVADEDGKGQALALLVGTGRRFGGESSTELVQHPGLGCRKA